MSTANLSLPKVQTRKEFMDCLEDMIYPPKYEDEEYLSKDRLRELKTYILESDEDVLSQFNIDGISCEVVDTGLESMKILYTTHDNNTNQFFLDVSDKRFLLLHTNNRSESTNKIIESLTKDHHHTFDNTWFYSNMLKRIASKSGNSCNGFGISYSNKFLRSVDDADIEDLNISINGSMATKMQQFIEDASEIRKTIAYNKIRVLRGTNSQYDSVQDDIYNTGYFAVKRGKSVQDHLQLVNICKDEYAEKINEVEKLRIGVRKTEGRTLADGKSFDFRFPNKIKDLDLFIEKMFSSTMPFKLWGLKFEIHDGYFKILAIDLHTGSPMDFEIADDMMRIYIFKGNCGNTILRLFTNLQMHYDAHVTCDKLS